MRGLLVVLAVVLPAVSFAQKPQNQLLEVLQQLTKLESEIRQLRGEVERLSYENRQMKSQQNDLYTDLDQRMRSLEVGAPAGMAGQAPAASQLPPNQLAIEPVAPATKPPAQVTPQTPVTSSTPSSPVSTPAVVSQPPAVVAPANPSRAQAVANLPPADPAKEQEAYKDAFNLLKVGKYDEAIVAYANFLAMYPGGSYASNAQYWLGEANYVRRQFPQALTEFRKVENNYPESRKLPDAMLKIGYIHYELKDYDQARRALSELTQKFPGTTPARLAENRLQRMKLEGH